MPDVAINAQAVINAGQGYVVPDSQEIVIKAVRASYDGSAAAGSFVPTLQIVTDAGIVAAECPVSSTLAAGASADVSWFRGVTPHQGEVSQGQGLPVPPWTVDYVTGEVTGDIAKDGGGSYVALTPLSLAMTTSNADDLVPLVVSGFSNGGNVQGASFASNTTGAADSLGLQAVAAGINGVTVAGVFSAATSGSGAPTGAAVYSFGATGSVGGNHPVGLEVAATVDSGYVRGVNVNADSAANGPINGLVVRANGNNIDLPTAVTGVYSLATRVTDGGAATQPTGGVFIGTCLDGGWGTGVIAQGSKIGLSVSPTIVLDFINTGMFSEPTFAWTGGVLFVSGPSGGPYHLKIRMNGVTTTIV